MRPALICIVLVFLCPMLLHAQDIEYPHPLKPGKNFKGSAAVDTLFWVLKSTQYNNCLRNTLDLKTSKSLNEALTLKADKLEQVVAKKDSTITDLTQGYNRYKNMWEETDRKLEEQEIKVLKLKRAAFISGFAGIGLGLLIGVLAF